MLVRLLSQNYTVNRKRIKLGKTVTYTVMRLGIVFSL